MKRTLGFLFLFIISLGLFAEEPKFLEEQEWPKTCKEAVDWLIASFDEETKKTVKETLKDDLIKYHHGWGTGIRNNFGLWRGNKSLMQSCLALRKNEKIHPDSVSMIIIEEIWHELNKDKESMSLRPMHIEKNPPQLHVMQKNHTGTPLMSATTLNLKEKWQRIVSIISEYYIKDNIHIISPEIKNLTKTQQNVVIKKLRSTLEEKLSWKVIGSKFSEKIISSCGQEIMNKKKASELDTNCKDIILTIGRIFYASIAEVIIQQRYIIENYDYLVCQEFIDEESKINNSTRTTGMDVYNNNTSQEKLAKSVTQTLIFGDKSAFKSFAVPEQDILLGFIKKQIPIDKQEKETEDVINRYNKIKNTIFSSWNDIYCEGIKGGIEWKDVSFEKVKYKLENNLHFIADIYIEISYNNIKYTIELSDCIFINGKWYILGKLRIT